MRTQLDAQQIRADLAFIQHRKARGSARPANSGRGSSVTMSHYDERTIQMTEPVLTLAGMLIALAASGAVGCLLGYLLYWLANRNVCSRHCRSGCQKCRWPR